MNRLFIFFVILTNHIHAQVSYGSALTVALNKTDPSYSGNAVQVRRACDNATLNIGFSTCGDLDTAALNAFAGLHTFPLTSITASATAAYSLRKVSCAYSGSAITVRSSAAGNPTLNIGFTVNGDLDTAALKAFAGSNSAYVTTWYDQSGNGKHVSQPTIANQPRIVNAGIISRQNGRPAINFISGSSTSFFLNAYMMSDKISVSIIAKVNNAAARNTLFDLGAIPPDYPDFAIEANTWSTAGSKWGFYSNNNSLDGTVATSTNLTSLSIVAQNTYTNATNNLIPNTSFYVNGAASALSCRSCVTGKYRASWPNGFVIGNFNGAYVSYLDGYISEFIIFPSALSTTERQFLEWTQAQYYSITTGVALGTLPAGTLPAAYVATWYDQSGSGKDLSQSTNSKQPQIISKGVVIKQGTKPAVLGSTSLQAHLSSAFATAYTGKALTANAVIQPDVTSTANLRVMSVGNLAMNSADWSNVNYFNVNLRNTNQFVIERSGVTPATSFVVSTPMILSVRFDGANRQLFNNGTGSSTAADASSFNFNSIRVLHSINPGYEAVEGFAGRMSAFSLYYSSLSTTRRTLIESNQSAYYGITVSNNKYTPPTSTSYNRFVNGIGRTSATDTVLGTRQTSGMGLSSGLVAGTDFLQSDGDYMTLGMNCPEGPGTSVANISAPIVQRWINDWYINKTDAGTGGGSIRIFFDYSDYGYTGGFSPGVASNYELLVRNSPSGTFSIVTGTTKSVAGDRVIFDVPAASITTNAYYTIGTQSTSVSPLPIELLSFTAQANDDRVDLNWATATEKNNKFFTIERSRNGVEFESIKTVDSKANNGNSQVRLDYNAIDPYPYEGTSYYRLKQTDFSGESKGSAMVDVYFSSSNDIAIEVYPNPNNGEFTLDFKGVKKNNGNAQLTLFDALGKKVYQESLVLSKETSSLQVIPSQKLVKGIYFLSCVLEKTTYTRKIVVN